MIRTVIDVQPFVQFYVIIPVTCPATVIGIPIAPKATGAVFAIKQRPAAYKGFNPRPARSAAVIATGAPNPAAPSKNAPNENRLK